MFVPTMSNHFYIYRGKQKKTDREAETMARLARFQEKLFAAQRSSGAGDANGGTAAAAAGEAVAERDAGAGAGAGAEEAEGDVDVNSSDW